jgi:tetratricopeptide (TPR) repeat protein
MNQKRKPIAIMDIVPPQRGMELVVIIALNKVVLIVGHMEDRAKKIGYLIIVLLISIKSFSQTAIDYYNMGLSKYQSNDNYGAILYYNKAIELNPNYGDAYCNRGYCKYKLGDYQSAIADYTKAILINPTDCYAYVNRGIAKSQLGDYRGDLFDCDRAIQISPNFALAYYNRGIAKALLNDKNGSCSDWSFAGQLGQMAAYDMIREYCN